MTPHEGHELHVGKISQEPRNERVKCAVKRKRELQLRREGGALEVRMPRLPGTYPANISSRAKTGGGLVTSKSKRKGKRSGEVSIFREERGELGKRVNRAEGWEKNSVCEERVVEKFTYPDLRERSSIRSS